ncbi:MAG TPA: ATP-binding cassette domain-containing protein [Gaiellaceae bacterium]|nr:ATP-binding cassette domain-containing protein [Gaiellaceae bacterium]
MTGVASTEPRGIEIRDLFRVHQTPEGDAAALQGLSLAIPEGEVVVVLGPSGSGKTTLLRILAGFDRPSAGSVRVFGEDVARLPLRRLARYRTEMLGYVDQHYLRSLAAELPARELVALQLGLDGWTRAERTRRADELLERVGLLAERERRPGELSGGEQQRVAVCAALAHRPRLFLADEPTGELDAANAERLYDLIGDLARAERCTAVLVSHDPASARIADRIVRIRDGRVSEESAAGAGEDELVVGRGGWLRLPEEFLRRAGIGERARAHLEAGRIVVTPAPGAAAAGRDRAVVELPPAAGGLSVELRGVSKRYGETVPLAGLDATFERGRLVAVTGPSGSGKTTLLHVLAGLELPDEGEVLLGGVDVASLGRDARARLRRDVLGYVGQQPGLTPFLSARENVELGLALRGTPATEATRRALDALEAVGLGERTEQRVERLSGGERLRVAVARALAPRPAILLADEPTSRLDQANALAVAVLLARLAREHGATIVCATHDPIVVEQADEELALAYSGSSRAAKKSASENVG